MFFVIIGDVVLQSHGYIKSTHFITHCESGNFIFIMELDIFNDVTNTRDDCCCFYSR